MPASPFGTAQGPKSPHRPDVLKRWAVWGLAFCVLSAGLAQLAYDLRVQLCAATGKYCGFVQAQVFPLRDSLPALSGGLSNLEAFKLAPVASVRTNADRSLWILDSIGSISLEYHTDKLPFDSVQLFLWTSDSFVASRTYKNRGSVSWNPAPKSRIRSWTEIVGAYASYPKLLRFHSADTSVRIFDPIEGKVIHAVRGRYRNHNEIITRPDTAYPVPEAARELTLLEKGSSLAVVNPSETPVQIRLVLVESKRWHVLQIEGHSVQVYRNLLRHINGNILAYTRPNETFPVFREDTRNPAQFFLLVK
jgi:hypothetical protein